MLAAFPCVQRRPLSVKKSTSQKLFDPSAFQDEKTHFFTPSFERASGWTLPCHPEVPYSGFGYPLYGL